jgi:hypothetical protein
MATVVMEMALPVGSTPPLHVHHDLDDTWYIGTPASERVVPPSPAFPP